MVSIMGQNKTNQLITSGVVNNGTQCLNSTHFNSTHGGMEKDTDNKDEAWHELNEKASTYVGVDTLLLWLIWVELFEWATVDELS